MKQKPSISNKFLLILSIFIFFTFIYSLYNEQNKTELIPFSDFLNLIESQQVNEVLIQGNQITFIHNQKKLYTYTPNFYEKLIPTLYKNGVVFQVQNQDSSSNLFLAILGSWLPIILIIGVWIFFMKQMQGGGNLMGFGKSKAKLIDPEKNKITFKNVAGIDEAKEELDEIVSFLKNPTKFEKLGAKIPTGILLIGSPGTGKTLLAKAIAGEAEASFLTISGSDFVEMFVGVGASRIRDLFVQAREKAPCIIFMDEIDAVGRHRGAGLGGGNDEREQTLNQLLVEMDGFKENNGVIVVAATNRHDILDPALMRPGRFDRRIVVPIPDLAGRKKILDLHTKTINISSSVNLNTIAKGTPGFTGADLANLVNESALLTAKRGKSEVEEVEFEDARDKLIMGSQRKTMIMSEEEKNTTAYHEAGHAIVAAVTEHADPVHKVTIIPRGKALGVTMLLPQQDQFSQQQKKLEDSLAMMMGGRAAEEIIFNHITTGASNDLEKATSIAHQMVCNWGMSDKVGPIFLTLNEGEVFVGKDIMKRRVLSEKFTKLIDQEVNKIIVKAYKRAKLILNKNKIALHKLAKLLIEKETIPGKSVLEVIESSIKKIKNVKAAT